MIRYDENCRGQLTTGVLHGGPAKATVWGVLCLLVFAGCQFSGSGPKFIRRVDWAGRGQWIKVDSHIHSRFSDGAHTISDIAHQASKFGCDAIAITDHADLDRQAATVEYFDEIQAARRQFPQLMIMAGLEWNVPPFGGDEHATVLVPESREASLAEFKSEFDDYKRSTHSPERAAAAIRWLETLTYPGGVKPVVLLEHPSRKSHSSLEVAETIKQLRRDSNVLVGMSAPGHQAGQPVGAYKGREAPIDRWDPSVARVGDAWDRLLLSGMNVWGAAAPSDFHRADGNTWNDYWPGQFSETWAYVPERTIDGLLRAFHAGSFFGVHGHIARDVQLEVDVEGLPRPALPGETIQVAPSAQIFASIRCEIPSVDWAGKPNRIDHIELIAVSSDGGRVIASSSSNPSGATRLASLKVPAEGCVLRARGRRLMPDGPELQFYTNPVRIVVDAGPIPRLFAITSQIPIRMWGGIGLAFVATLSLAGRFWRRGARPGRRVTAVGSVRSTANLRRWWLGLAVACAGFAVYGSLLPFQFRPLSWTETWTQFVQLRHLPSWSSGRVDVLTNALLYIPIGFGLMGATSARRTAPARTLVLALLTLCLSTVLSIAIEVAQVWLPSRVPSFGDVAAQLIGTAIGIVAWLLAGNAIENGARVLTSSTHPLRRTEVLLRACFVAILFSNLLPFDLTIHPGDLWDKFQEGKIVLRPFQDFQWSGESIPAVALQILFAVPLGMLAASLANRPRLNVVLATIIAALLLAGIEFAQLFIRSRHASTTDIVIGGAGALVGVWLQRRLSVATTSHSVSGRQFGLSCLLAISYLMVPCAVLWWPFEFSTDQTMLAAKLQRLADVPLSQFIMRQSYLRSLTQALERTALFIPFGLLVGASLMSGSTATRSCSQRYYGVGIALTLIAAAAIEAGQLFIPARVPDLVDILFAVAGGGAGLLGCRLIASENVGSRGPSPGCLQSDR